MTIALPRPSHAVHVYGFAGFAAVALVVALRAPLATTVLGLIIFGALHNVLELRYVTGRFAGVLNDRLLWTVVALITGVVICRLGGFRIAEVLIAYSIIGVALRSWLARAGLVPLALASLTWPAYHFVVLSHLHNIVPLFFLWEWSRNLPSRNAFRATQIGWVLVIPALILAGAFDPWLNGSASAVVAFAGNATSIAAPVTPPGLTTGLRFLTVFAFLQTMHYAVWVGFFPRVAPQETVPALRGSRAWLLGIAAAAVLGVLFVIDYRQGRTVYQAFASYHAYLEFPVLLALLLRAK